MTIIKLLENNNIEFPIINIVNIGAMNPGKPEIYQPLKTANISRIIGFEPQNAECDKLNMTSGKNEKYFPYFIGDGKRRKFYFTIFPITSSLYEPDTNLLNKFHNLANFLQIDKIEAVETKRLDDVKELPDDIDYIKIDVQGAEHLIFQNAPRVLEQAILIDTVVELVPIYKEQPLFADVDKLLRKHNFEFHKMRDPIGRPIKPLFNKSDPSKLISQQLWTNAIYVKNFMDRDKIIPEKLLKLAIILDLVYGSVDLCYLFLCEYDKKIGTTLANNYFLKLIGS